MVMCMNDSCHSPAAPASKTPFSCLGLLLSLFLIGTTAVQYGLVHLFEACFPHLIYSWWFPWLLLSAPLFCVGLPLLWLTLRRIPVSPPNRLCGAAQSPTEKPRFTVGHFLLLVVMSFACMDLLAPTELFLMSFPSFLGGAYYGEIFELGRDLSPLWLTLLVSCILLPIGEELIFRKLLIDRARGAGDTVAILLSAALFGLFHANLSGFFSALAAGLLLGYIYTRTHHIGWCVLLHALINFVHALLIPTVYGWLPSDGDAPDAEAENLFFLCVAICACLLIVAGILLLVLRVRHRVLSAPPSGRSFREELCDALINPGMILALVVFLLFACVRLFIPVI